VLIGKVRASSAKQSFTLGPRLKTCRIIYEDDTAVLKHYEFRTTVPYTTFDALADPDQVCRLTLKPTLERVSILVLDFNTEPE